MEDEYLIDNLPVYTDNILSDDGLLLVPGYWRNANLADSLLHSPDELETFPAPGSGRCVTNLLNPGLLPLVRVLLLIDEESGEITDTNFNNATNFALFSSTYSLEEDEYLVGPVFVGAATVRDFESSERMLQLSL